MLTSRKTKRHAMRTRYLTLRVIALLLTGSSIALGSPPTVDDPYRIKTVKFHPKPELDKWSTVEITLQADRKPLINRLDLLFSASKIELDLPMPETAPQYQVSGLPYKIKYRGRQGQLPSWTEIKKGDTHTIKFKIRPYWFGDGKIHIQGINDGIWVGIGKDGHPLFVGTNTELEKKLGPRQTPTDAHPEMKVFSPDQMAKRYNLLGLGPYDDTLPPLQRSIAELRWQVWAVPDGDGIVWHQQGLAGLFRVDAFLKRMPRWQETTAIEVRIKTRLPKEALPTLEVMQTHFGAADVMTDVKTAAFTDLGDGVYSATFNIRPGDQRTQQLRFRMVRSEVDEQTKAQLPVYGFYLNFDETGKCISLQ